MWILWPLWIDGYKRDNSIYTNIIAIDKELFLAKLLDGCSHVLIDGKGEVICR